MNFQILLCSFLCCVLSAFMFCYFCNYYLLLVTSCKKRKKDAIISLEFANRCERIDSHNAHARKPAVQRAALRSGEKGGNGPAHGSLAACKISEPARRCAISFSQIFCESGRSDVCLEAKMNRVGEINPRSFREPESALPIRNIINDSSYIVQYIYEIARSALTSPATTKSTST